MKSVKQEILSVLSGKQVVHIPAFSGLISVTGQGLEREGLQFHEVHRDAAKMARAAASSHRHGGLPSAVLPLDLCVEAEALGVRIDYREGERAGYPRVKDFLYGDVKAFITEHNEFTEQPEKGSVSSVLTMVSESRIPLVCEAIQLVKADVGQDIVIGGYLPGPFTLLSLLVETGALYQSLRKSPDAVHAALETLTRVIAGSASAYRKAGADFLTVHEMGGSPGAVGPRVFEAIVLPHLQALFAALPRPVVLSCCGRTNGKMKLLAASGADALSVDQTNDLVASRAEVPEALLFGNLDPVGLLGQATPEEVREAVTAASQAGADAVWPGCDLFPDTPLENLRALAETPS